MIHVYCGDEKHNTCRPSLRDSHNIYLRDYAHDIDYISSAAWGQLPIGQACKLDKVAVHMTLYA